MINVSAVSHYGRQGEMQAAEGLRDVCDALRATETDLPCLRGIYVILPLALLNRSEELIARAGQVQKDLRMIRQGMRVECPVYVVVTQMEQVPGFLEFARELGPSVRINRWGCSFTHRLDRTTLEPEGGLAWFQTRALDPWCLQSIVKGAAMDLERNARFVRLVHGFREFREPLGRFFRLAFPPGELPLPHAIDFPATGSAPEARAFDRPVFLVNLGRGLYETSWAESALAEDRSDRRRAWKLSIIAVLAMGLVWGYILWVDSLGRVGQGLAAAFGLLWGVDSVLVEEAMARRRRLLRPRSAERDQDDASRTSSTRK